MEELIEKIKESVPEDISSREQLDLVLTAALSAMVQLNETRWRYPLNDLFYIIEGVSRAKVNQYVHHIFPPGSPRA